MCVCFVRLPPNASPRRSTCSCGPRATSALTCSTSARDHSCRLGCALTNISVCECRVWHVCSCGCECVSASVCVFVCICVWCVSISNTVKLLHTSSGVVVCVGPMARVSAVASYRVARTAIIASQLIASPEALVQAIVSKFLSADDVHLFGVAVVVTGDSTRRFLCVVCVFVCVCARVCVCLCAHSTQLSAVAAEGVARDVHRRAARRRQSLPRALQRGAGTRLR